MLQRFRGHAMTCVRKDHLHIRTRFDADMGVTIFFIQEDIPCLDPELSPLRHRILGVSPMLNMICSICTASALIGSR